MENWERQLNQVQVPDPIVSSHRDGLRKKLQSGRIPGSHVGRTVATLGVSTLVALGALTMTYPGWAKDLWNTTLVRTITFQTKDGATVMIRKMSADQCSTAYDPTSCMPTAGIPPMCGSLGGAPMAGDSLRCKMMIVKHEDIGTDGFKMEE